MMVIGIDAHKRTHTAVATDQMGQQLSTKTVGTKSKDHLATAMGEKEREKIVSGRSRIAGT